MQSSTELRSMLSGIHRKSYPAYKSLRGSYDFREYTLSIDHVQGDPFASPSNVSVHIPLLKTGIPKEYYQAAHTKTALEDALLRQFESEIQKYNFRAKGSSKSGLISVSRPDQEILKRTALSLTSRELIARFEVGFPANGRTINAPELEKILFDFLPVCVRRSFYYKNLDAAVYREVFELAENQQFIRNEIKRLNLAAFVADGSVLPRESGVSSRPLRDCVPFVSPESLRITLDLPYKGKLSGMGIPKGITLIVGGGYHGKSTLLNALERGVYSHIKGDGREYVISDESGLKLRAEDGRSIRNVDISLFINDLPNKKDTHSFSTPDASGSTSQAAGIVEGMESGSRLFFIDEDTSATNFMVRDTFMQEVIHRDKEPITPFLERARDLYEKADISTILVAGSSGAFFHIADTVIQMDCYRPFDITDNVKGMLDKYPLTATHAPAFTLPDFQRSLPLPRPSSKRMGHREDDRIKTKVRGRDGFQIGKETVDLRFVEQIVDTEQTAALAALLKYAIEHPAGKTLRETVAHLQSLLDSKGMEFLFDGCERCGFALPRIQEIFCCFNRYRGER